MSVFKYFAKIDVKHVPDTSGGLLTECSIGDPKRRRLKLKHAWHWFVLLPTTAGLSQVVVDWVASRVEFQVGEPYIDGSHKHQKFSS